MADPFSLATTAFALVGQGITLTKTIKQLVDQVGGARGELSVILRDLESTTSVLHQFKDEMENEESRPIANETFSKEVQDTIANCKKTFGDLRGVLVRAFPTIFDAQNDASGFVMRTIDKAKSPYTITQIKPIQQRLYDVKIDLQLKSVTIILLHVREANRRDIKKAREASKRAQGEQEVLDYKIKALQAQKRLAKRPLDDLDDTRMNVLNTDVLDSPYHTTRIGKSPVPFEKKIKQPAVADEDTQRPVPKEEFGTPQRPDSAEHAVQVDIRNMNSSVGTIAKVRKISEESVKQMQSNAHAKEQTFIARNETHAAATQTSFPVEVQNLSQGNAGRDVLNHDIQITERPEAGGDKGRQSIWRRLWSPKALQPAEAPPWTQSLHNVAHKAFIIYQHGLLWEYHHLPLSTEELCDLMTTFRQKKKDVWSHYAKTTSEQHIAVEDAIGSCTKSNPHHTWSLVAAKILPKRARGRDIRNIRIIVQGLGTGELKSPGRSEVLDLDDGQTKGKKAKITASKESSKKISKKTESGLRPPPPPSPPPSTPPLPSAPPLTAPRLARHQQTLRGDSMEGKANRVERAIAQSHVSSESQHKKLRDRKTPTAKFGAISKELKDPVIDNTRNGETKPSKEKDKSREQLNAKPWTRDENAATAAYLEALKQEALVDGYRRKSTNDEKEDDSTASNAPFYDLVPGPGPISRPSKNKWVRKKAAKTAYPMMPDGVVSRSRALVPRSTIVQRRRNRYSNDFAAFQNGSYSNVPFTPFEFAQAYYASLQAHTQASQGLYSKENGSPFEIGRADPQPTRDYIERNVPNFHVDNPDGTAMPRDAQEYYISKRDKDIDSLFSGITGHSSLHQANLHPDTLEYLDRYTKLDDATQADNSDADDPVERPSNVRSADDMV